MFKSLRINCYQPLEEITRAKKNAADNQLVVDNLRDPGFLRVIIALGSDRILSDHEIERLVMNFVGGDLLPWRQVFEQPTDHIREITITILDISDQAKIEPGDRTVNVKQTLQNFLHKA